MDRARLSPGNCSCLSSGQARLLQSGRPLERRPAPGMGLDPVSAHDLKCRGGRVGGSASRKELHATRVPPQEMKSPLPPSIIAPHRFFCRVSRAGCINQNGAGNSRSLFESSTPPRNAGLFRPLRAISSVKLSLRLKSPLLPQEMERWLPQASRSSTRLRK